MKKNTFIGILLIFFLSIFSSLTLAQIVQEKTSSIFIDGKTIATFSLQCRGGSREDFPMTASFPVPDSGDQNTAELFLRFQKSAETKNLQPGECSWLDRPINSDEPSEVRFLSSPQSVKKIMQSLSNSKYYASFMVFNTKQGFLRALAYKISQSVPENNVNKNAQSIEQNTPTVQQKISNVRITPSLTEAGFSFLTAASAKVQIEISTRQPQGLLFDEKFIVCKKIETSAGGQREVNTNVSDLRPGQHYFYIISVVEGNGANDPLVRYLGDFYTQRSTSINSKVIYNQNSIDVSC